MRKMKKFISLFVATAMCVGMLSGCAASSGKKGDGNDATQVTETTDGTNSTNEADNKDGDTTDTVASALPDMTTEDITLTYVHFDNEPLVQYLAEKFMEKYPNIKVDR